MSIPVSTWPSASHFSQPKALNVDQTWIDRYVNYLDEAVKIWCNHKKDRAVKTFGVESSTARAFRAGLTGQINGPLAIYKEWAENTCESLLKDDDLCRRIESYDEFKKWHKSISEYLVEHWEKRVNENIEIISERISQLDPVRDATEIEKYNLRKESTKPNLNVAHRFKMVDLFVRWLRTKNQLIGRQGLAEALRKNGHIPLDKKSISVICAVCSEQPLKPGHNRSMGDIKTPGDYEFFQKVAREICIIAEKNIGKEEHRKFNSPLLFDVFAWNNMEAQKLYTKPQ